MNTHLERTVTSAEIIAFQTANSPEQGIFALESFKDAYQNGKRLLLRQEDFSGIYSELYMKHMVFSLMGISVWESVADPDGNVYLRHPNFKIVACGSESCVNSSLLERTNLIELNITH